MFLAISYLPETPRTYPLTVQNRCNHWDRLPDRGGFARSACGRCCATDAKRWGRCRPIGRNLWPVPLSPELRSPLGGFLSGWTALMPPFFRIARARRSRLIPSSASCWKLAGKTLEHRRDPDPTSLPGARRCFGTFSHDYERLQGQAESGAGPYFLTGCSAATAAGQFSFFYDLHCGPAVAVDTASSASRWWRCTGLPQPGRRATARWRWSGA